MTALAWPAAGLILGAVWTAAAWAVHVLTGADPAVALGAVLGAACVGWVVAGCVQVVRR